MRTSEAAISACMELLNHAFVGLRSIASMEVGNRQMEEIRSAAKNENSLKIKEYLSKQARQYRTMMRCLITDIGDEVIDETMNQIDDLAEKWHSEFLKQRMDTKDLVSDDIKLKIFEFIDTSLESVEKYCNSETNEDAEKLYWEMDRAHNVPHEIYIGNKNRFTKYGNFFNR